jgi:hypothetical protein
VEDWAEIRRLHMSEQLGIKTIARRLGLARNTVRAALAADDPPRYERSPGGSVVDGFEQDYGCSAMSCVTLVVKTVTAAVAKSTPPTHWLG